MKKSKRRRRVLLILLLLLVCMVALAFFSLSTRLQRTEYKVKISDLPDGLEGLRIVHISDLHSTIFGEGQAPLVTMVREAPPELILLTGDICDNVVPHEGTMLFLEGIRDLCPIYYVSGNHEIWATDYKEIMELIASYGVRVLQDGYETVPVRDTEILVAGVADPLRTTIPSSLGTFSAGLAAVDGADFSGLRMLLSHRPEEVELYRGTSFDLVFSGHAHGGQARIPLIAPEGLYAPNQGWFPTYTAGVHNLENTAGTQLIVSRGLSVADLPRVFNRPEVVVVTLYRG